MLHKAFRNKMDILKIGIIEITTAFIIRRNLGKMNVQTIYSPQINKNFHNKRYLSFCRQGSSESFYCTA